MISFGMENSTGCFCSFAKVAFNWRLRPSLSVVLMLNTLIYFYIHTCMCSSNNAELSRLNMT